MATYTWQIAGSGPAYLINSVGDRLPQTWAGLVDSGWRQAEPTDAAKRYSSDDQGRKRELWITPDGRQAWITPHHMHDVEQIEVF